VIISRTPFRISFFGGGTDYPAWYSENPGAVLATTINKYCYISCRLLPPFFEHKYRIVYSKVETVKEKHEIQHPAIRAAIDLMEINAGLEIHHDGDLPARTGLGSSSSFSVGMLHTLFALKGIMPTRQQLALNAIHLERDILKESVGSQDQISAAIGGFNRVDFFNDNTYRETPITINPERIKELKSHLMFFFTGISRYSSEIAKIKIENFPNRKKEAITILNSKTTAINKFGELLDESWKLKRNLCNKISTSYIDEIYNAARSAGAIGGKILGAGGGGFMLLFAKPEHQSEIKKCLNKLLYVPFDFEHSGSQIILNEQD
jgi:D-glycero-alpha-D-manno-heptose-7-phosphate kinase